MTKIEEYELEARMILEDWLAEGWEPQPLFTFIQSEWLQQRIIRSLAAVKGDSAGLALARDKVQDTVINWGARCFGDDHMRDKIVRAARFIEEAAELVQAVGLSKDHAVRALDYVYSREPGDLAQELGGVSNTQYALAGALGLSVARCEAIEIARCLAKSPEHFASRNRDKVEKIDAALRQPPQPTGDVGELLDQATKAFNSRSPQQTQDLRDILTAWESLPEGQYRPATIERWLRETMRPAFAKVRAALTGAGEEGP